MLNHDIETTNTIDLFRSAEERVVAAGFGWEIAWQRQRLAASFSERDLLKEAAWVILCSGFREAAVRAHFNYISLCFCDWESAAEIAKHQSVCVSTASARFSNWKKLSAIVSVAESVATQGFESIQRVILQNPIRELQRFPYIGPVTSWHLAKNLGFDVAKNDRHLARIAERLGYKDAHGLCEDISAVTGEPASVVDIVLWRFAALSQNAAYCPN